MLCRAEQCRWFPACLVLPSGRVFHIDTGNSKAGQVASSAWSAFLLLLHPPLFPPLFLPIFVKFGALSNATDRSICADEGRSTIRKRYPEREHTSACCSRLFRELDFDVWHSCAPRNLCTAHFHDFPRLFLGNADLLVGFACLAGPFQAAHDPGPCLQLLPSNLYKEA